MELLVLTAIVLLLTFLADLISTTDEESDKQSFGRSAITANGEVVRSEGECKIADYLANLGVTYRYETEMYGLCPDFYLPDYDVIIEYWGLVEDVGEVGTHYRNSMAKKLRRYSKANQRVISIMPREISSREYMNKLDQIVKSG